MGGAVDGWSGLRGLAVGVAWRGPGERAVGALLVVVLAERVELALEFGDGAGRWPGAKPAFLGLVEAFDLALGLGVAGGSVLLANPEQRQEVFEGVATAAEAGGVDAAVIGQRARRSAVIVNDR